MPHRHISGVSAAAIEMFTDNIISTSVDAEKVKSIGEQFVDYTFIFYKLHPHWATETGRQNM